MIDESGEEFWFVIQSDKIDFILFSQFGRLSCFLASCLDLVSIGDEPSASCPNSPWSSPYSLTELSDE